MGPATTMSTAPLPTNNRPPARKAGLAWLTLPFDALRFQYANAVVAGVVPRSLLASARSERSIDALERLSLGRMARQR